MHLQKVARDYGFLTCSVLLKAGTFMWKDIFYVLIVDMYTWGMLY